MMSGVHNSLIHSSSQPPHNLGRYFNNVKGNSIFWRGKNAIQFGNKMVLTASSNNVSETYKKKPIVIKDGKGCKLYDVEENEYLDMVAAGDAPMGHKNEDCLKAVMGNIMHTIPQVGKTSFL
jgi:glutamate-1-semialdehyde aminotransferase